MNLEFSAGGIVYKKSKDKTYILLGQHSGHHGWVFPKGRIGDHIKNESKIDTAIREVKEETGVLGEIKETLIPITYWYEWEGKKIRKTVYYYTMEYVGGDIKDHDWEMENVEWVEKDKVGNTLTYDSDKKVWRQAIKLV